MNAKTNKREVSDKYAIKVIVGKNKIRKAALVPAAAAGEGAKLYTVAEAVAVCREANVALPYWDNAGRPASSVTAFAYKLNRWGSPYIGAADAGGSAKAEAEYL